MTHKAHTAAQHTDLAEEASLDLPQAIAFGEALDELLRSVAENG